jgi:hypothetical protein
MPRPTAQAVSVTCFQSVELFHTALPCIKLIFVIFWLFVCFVVPNPKTTPNVNAWNATQFPHAQMQAVPLPPHPAGFATLNQNDCSTPPANNNCKCHAYFNWCFHSTLSHIQLFLSLVLFSGAKSHLLE